ncbi:MAG TPA: hypothetical protein PL029_11995 [Bacteroidia bacterium]|nr:hypothetical protein [Bacteroidia bacterium]
MKKWLFNPFETLAGWSALIIGLGVIFITAVIAFYSNTRFDGVIDFHITTSTSLSGNITEGLIDWLCLSLFVYVSGLLFSRSSIRLIDVAGTQAMARFPCMLAAVFSFFFFNNNVLHYFKYKLLNTGQPVQITGSDILLFSLGMLSTFLMLGWMIVLMYRAYCVSCNMKGAKAVFSFVACVIFAEILSKILISFLVPTQGLE